MNNIIEKLIRKYFEHLTKELWLKDIRSVKDINKQKEMLDEINDEVNSLIYETLLFMENQIELTKEIIEDNMENTLYEYGEDDE